MYSKNIDTATQLSRDENRAIDQLVSLLEENDQTDLIDCVDIDKLLTNVDSDSEAQSLKPKSTLKNKSDQFPPLSTNQNMMAFLKLVSWDLKQISIKAQSKDNLTPLERQALQDLSKNYSLVVKPSDKAGNIVLMNNDQYITMCKKILNNENWYQSIPLNMIAKFSRKFYDLMDTAGRTGIITATTWK